MRLSLAAKMSVALIGMLALALLSTAAAIISAYRFEAFQRTIVVENLASVRAAEELEIALLQQRGYVASYILDGGNTVWLEQMNQHRKNFDLWIAEARKTARSEEERKILDRLEQVQRLHARKRDEVVTLYNAGQEEQAKQVLLGDVSTLYKQAYDLCDQFTDANKRLVDVTSAKVRRQVSLVTVVVTVTLVVTVGSGLALLWWFFTGVILPLRRIAADARQAAGDESLQAGGTRKDDLRELGNYVQLLMANVAETRSDLEHSRTQLAHADKLAAVGRLAATVAHEIRNPLTSVKMWLYSLRRGVGQDDPLQQKFDIVSDEIARLENIIRNFLEFSRPPQLKVSAQPAGKLLEKTIELVGHRFEQQRIKVICQDEPDLPDVLADAEQLKQVFLNLINNAIEAMPQGGEIRVELSRSRHGGRDMVKVRLADTGPGMPQEVQERIFEPFFTTKDEGTGLGLCIAASVMARHGGTLLLESSNAHGTQWAVWIPTCS